MSQNEICGENVVDPIFMSVISGRGCGAWVQEYQHIG